MMAAASANPSSPIRNISDTALWVALYRAQESDREDAHFHDPYARKLAGDRGAQILEHMPAFAKKHAWPYVARTWSIDQVVEREVARGTDAVLNLAAGLDTRPYRLKLPPTLRWVEVDLSEMLNYKEDALAGERPVCRLERVAMDLRDMPARRDLFRHIGDAATRVLVISEGLLVYLETEEVKTFARDLAEAPHFRHWINDLATPALLKMLQKEIGAELSSAGSPLKFAPPEGPAFFTPLGWDLVDTYSSMHTAAKLNRLTFFMRLFSLLPDTQGRKPGTPWGGVCVFENSQ